MSGQFSRWNDFLHFCDLLEDDRSKLSHTKVAAWGATLLNYANICYQFLSAHPDAPTLLATCAAHAVAAAKHEFKRMSV